MKALLPPNETQRLATLRGYDVIDTPPEPTFDDLTLLAAQICQVPFAEISLIDENRQWCKSIVGLNATETSRDVAFCSHSILNPDELLEVCDAQLDPRFVDNPHVTGDPHIRFYAGAPLVAPNGHALGTLCVIDLVPRELSSEQKNALRVLSHAVIAQLELRTAYRRAKEQVEARTADLAQEMEMRRESEERFRQLSENIRAVFWMTDPAKNEMLYISPAYEQIWGRTVQSLYDVPQDWLEVIHADDRQRVLQAALTKQDAGLYDEEYRIVRPGGEVRWIHDKAFPVRDSEGAVYRIVGVAEDITERKSKDQEIQEHQARINGLVDAAMDAIVSTDENQNIIIFNHAAEQMFGYLASEIIGQPLDLLMPVRYQEKHRKHVDKFGKTGKSTRTMNMPGQSYGLRANGEEFLFEASISVMKVAGSLVYTAILRDITLRKQAEADLRIAATAFQTHESLMITDANRVIIRVNQAFIDETGYSSAEMMGKTASILKSGRHDAAFYREMWESINQTGQWQGEIWDKRKNGEIYPKWLSITAVKDTHGVVTHYVGSHTDITRRKEMDDKLHATTSELIQANAKIEEERAMLAQRVLERTAQLEYANHAKDSFLATMSHEIRTPLGGLLGMMELLSLSRLEPQQSELLGAARKSGDSLLRIVNDILDWSKIEAGKLELAPHAATLSDMLENVASTYAQIASEKNIHLNVEIDPELSTAHHFDPLRISQILNNFTSNAIKFTERGTVHIRASMIASHHDAETVRLSVQDSGVGISPEQQQRLFQQYEQASAETARMYGGTGLGLAICRRLADLMGGTLSVASTLGSGSTFSLTVDLPVADQPERDRLPQHGDGQDSLGEIPNASSLTLPMRHVRLLIVDDHSLNRMLLERMLLKQQLGMLEIEVEQAVDGNEALAK